MYNLSMKNIFCIQYVDAYYVYSEKRDQTFLKPHRAYGYVVPDPVSTIILFTIEKDKKYKKGEEIYEGLIIPTKALKPYQLKKFIALEKEIQNCRGAHSAVIWLDVVHVGGLARSECAQMYTEGVLHRIEKDHIVIKNPETIRVYPAPVRNHPEKKPTFYIIPKSFIEKIEKI